MAGLNWEMKHECAQPCVMAGLKEIIWKLARAWLNRLVLKTSDRKRSIRSNRIVSVSSKVITWHYPQSVLYLIYHNQVWRKPSSICWVCFYEVLSTNPTLRKFTQCWQKGRFAKSLGLRKKASRIDTCNFRHLRGFIGSPIARKANQSANTS